MGNEEKGRSCNPGRVASCLRTFLAHLFSHIGLCVLIVGYAIAGAALFENLESDHEIQERNDRSKNWTRRFRDIRQQYVDELWNITEQFNVLYENNWTAAVEEELRKFEAVVASTAKREGYEGERREVENQWTFSGALLYSVSIITTIGYGNTAPRTSSGKILTMFYAVLGVPLMLLWLSNIGTLMANTFKFAYAHSCGAVQKPRVPVQHDSAVRYSVSGKKCELVLLDPPRPKPLATLDPAAKKVLLECAEYNVSVCGDETSARVVSQLSGTAEDSDSDEERPRAQCTCGSFLDDPGTSVQETPSKVPLIPDPPQPDSDRVPISLVLVFVVVYIMVGAAVFSMWEEWNFLESAYFCFITLSTIGLGDYVPGRSLRSAGAEEGHAQLVVCCLYLVLGLAIIAMSFNLVQEEVAAKVKNLARRLGIIKDIR